MKNRPFGNRIGYAIEGLRTGWRRERSFRTQVLAAAGVGAMLILLRPAPIWWAIVVLVAGIVLMLELVNSAVEALADLLHPAIHPEVKALKDMLAGAVLIASLCAVAVGAALAAARFG
jgi:diacylglycerol kinase (ATP)